MNSIDRQNEPLLLAIKSSLPGLETLLSEVQSHWHGEDKFYRFYHQSFKLFGLQRDTERIAEALQKLSPDSDFHPFFQQIISDGTGLEFEADDNADWLTKGRPILEAFFHARTMLELVVKYGTELDHAPTLLPSGWAAVLELYGSR